MRQPERAGGSSRNPVSTLVSVALTVCAALVLLSMTATGAGQQDVRISAAAKSGGGGATNQVIYTGVQAAFLDPPEGFRFSGIAGDGFPYVGDPTNSTTFGAFFIAYKTSGTDDFDLLLDRSNVRYIVLDLSHQAQAGTCGLACRKPTTFDSPFPLYQTWGPNGLRVRPIDRTTNAALPGGMEAMSPGVAYPAVVVMNFQWPDKNGTPMVWKLSFQASEMQVTTTGKDAYGNQSWTIEPSGGAVAQLHASPDGSARKQTDEGQYVVPFSITVTK